MVGIFGGLYGSISAIRYRRAPIWAWAALVIVIIEVLVMLGWAANDYAPT